MTISRTGGAVLVDQLIRNEVDTIFAVAGESYLAVTDAMYDREERIRVITCRQEGGAAFMAEAMGKLTGRPGVAMVTRGPGATNASIGVHVAFQDSTPMILLVGQVDREFSGREGFQELDYVQVFSGLAKDVVQIENAEMIPEVMHRAFTVAMSGRPGPVVIALPEDMLCDMVQVADAPAASPARSSGSPADLDKLVEMIEGARRPLFILGGSCWDDETATAMVSFAESADIPVATTFRRQDLVDHHSKVFAGSLGTGLGPTTSKNVQQSDLLVVIGGRLGEMTTNGYTLLGVPEPGVPLVHVYPSAEELGRVYHADLALHADPRSFVPLLAERQIRSAPSWSAWRELANAAYLTASTPDQEQLGLDLSEVVRYISDTVPKDTVITNGAGNYTAWMHRYHRFRQHPTQLGPTAGAMGYGLPAAIAAAVERPNRLAIAFAGDGCMLMNGQELATAVRYQLPVIVVVVNNNHFGTIRLHQERRYPARVINTDLTNPDFAAYARSFGAWSEKVTDAADFPAAFERARKAGGPALLELITDPEQVTPDLRLSEVRTQSLRRGTGK